MYTVCECDHLAHFGILLRPDVEDHPQDIFHLSLICYVGITASVVAMALTVIANTCKK